jgi:PAS domain S-box-containing protein
LKADLTLGTRRRVELGRNSGTSRCGERSEVDDGYFPGSPAIHSRDQVRGDRRHRSRWRHPLLEPGRRTIFQYAENEAVGRSLDLIIPERLRARRWSGYRRFISTGRSRYGKGDLLAVPGVRKDGTRLSLEFTIVPLNDRGGGIIGVVALMRDVTARFEETRELKRTLN